MPTKSQDVKKSPFRSLRLKFTFVVIFLFIIIFGFLSVIAIRNFTITEKNNLTNQVKAFATLSTRPIGDTYNVYYSSGYLKFKELIESILSLNKDIKKIQIVGSNGEVLFDSTEFQSDIQRRGIVDPNLLSKITANSTSYIFNSKNSNEISEIIEPFFEDFGAHPFSIRYFVSYESINRTVDNIQNVIITLALIFLILSVILIVVVTNGLFLSPVKRVIDSAKAISEGDLEREIVVKTGDEIEELAVSVNHMAQTLRSNIEALKELDKLKDEFIMIASHHLRTPLTIIKGYLSFFKRGKFEPPLDKYLKGIDSSVKELGELIEELIGIVSFESKKEGLLKQKTDVRKLLEQSVGEFSQAAASKKINFVFEFPPKELPPLNIDKNKISLAINNLIDNAVKFNKENGRVEIAAKRKGDFVLISIADTGIGIEESKRHLVFSRFFRGTGTLIYNYKGVGLGLYITKLIIHAHGGKIWFESKPGEGTTFYFTLPINFTGALQRIRTSNAPLKRRVLYH